MIYMYLLQCSMHDNVLLYQIVTLKLRVTTR